MQSREHDKQVRWEIRIQYRQYVRTIGRKGCWQTMQQDQSNSWLLPKWAVPLRPEDLADWIHSPRSQVSAKIRYKGIGKNRLTHSICSKLLDGLSMPWGNISQVVYLF